MKLYERMNGRTFKIIIVSLILLVVIGVTYAINFNDTTYVVTVTDKERVNKENSSKYLIYVETNSGDVRTFENTDVMLRGKFNSSDIYATLKEGKKYKITVVGYRVPFFSWYENILEVEEVN